ncbi:MAG: CYTH domain-containing protein [Paenisporosarcina sp.]
MSNQIEIEFKNLLTREEFQNLCQAFSVRNTDFHSQTNTYFDTPNFDLRDSKSGFRLRVLAKRNELTLKSPSTDIHTMIETTELVSNEIRDIILQQGFIDTKQFAAFSHLPPLLHAFGSLRTERAEIAYEGGLLVLDHSHYMQKEDFEVEYEVEDVELGRTLFLELLAKYDIPMRQTDKKIARFMKAAWKQRG